MSKTCPCLRSSDRRDLSKSLTTGVNFVPIMPIWHAKSCHILVPRSPSRPWRQGDASFVPYVTNGLRNAWLTPNVQFRNPILSLQCEACFTSVLLITFAWRIKSNHHGDITFPFIYVIAVLVYVDSMSDVLR